MRQISKEEQAFVVEIFFERKSYVAACSFQVPPCKKRIQQNVAKCRSHGTSLNKNVLENNPNLTPICSEKYGRHVE